MKKFVFALAILACNMVINLYAARVLSETLDFPMNLPATINSVTYQHAYAYQDGVNKSYWYYNNSSSVINYGVLIPQNPGLYSPYNRTDIYFSDLAFCSENQYSVGQCSDSTNWTPIDLSGGWSNLGGICSASFVDNGYCFSDLDWWTVDSSLVNLQQFYKEANWNSLFPQQLTIILDSESGGGVASLDQEETIQCGVNSNDFCEADFPYNTEVELEAFPSGTDYEFAYWEWNEGANSSTNNPETFTMSETLEVTAVFNKTFRDAVTEGFTYDVDDVAGECVVYVRNETGIDYDAFNGNAEGCLSLAQEAGYATGTEPRVGAIAVFGSDAVPDVGHVGIVKVINSPTLIKLRHSNWCSPATCHTVSEDDINLITTPVMGYIYPTP